MYSKAQEKDILQKASKLGEGIGTLSIEEGMRQIEEVLNYADWKYYVQDNPVIVDKEYDNLFSLLKKLEAEHPNLQSASSPTQRVAKGLNDNFPTVKHLVPMLSLDNSYNAEDLNDWHERNIKLLGEEQEKISYCIEPKFDGASISLIYENNILTRGSTRGNGTAGDDITNNSKQIRSIPISAAFDSEGIDLIEMRGEVVIQKDKFKALNARLEAKGTTALANPRNAASGSLRMKDPNEVGERNLDAFVYHISHLEGNTPYETHYQSLELLSKKGFRSSFEFTQVFSDIKKVISFCADFEAKRDELPYEIDGLVIKVNSLAQQEKIGMTSHHPRWAMAYKFKARQGRSKLLDIEYQVGRTGSITPVAKIEPVQLAGVSISSISLFNEDIIREKDLRIGDTVLVERAGDVIPYIVKSFSELRDGSEKAVSFPKTCPSCATALEKPEEEAVWRCPNFDCAAQAAERIIHFASKNAMDIRGLGESNIRKFFAEGLLKDIPDIYNLPYEEIKSWEGFGAKSIEKLEEAVGKTKQQPINRLLFGLGIRYVGETTAKTLARSIEHINDLKNRSLEELLALEDVGEKVAHSILASFKDERFLNMLSTLEATGLNFKNEEEDVSDGALAGKTFLFTGTLPTLKRKAAEAMAEAKGGKILSGVSTKLNYLIAGEKAGSKLEKAKKLGSVKIISEAEFMELID